MLVNGYDERAGHYIHSCLAAGYTLAKKLNEIELSADEITCLLPDGHLGERKHNFTTGGISGNSWSHERANAELASLIQEYLASSEVAAAVIENREMALDSKFLSQLPFVHFGNEIYLLLGHGYASKKNDILRVLKAGTRYPFIMTLTKGNGKSHGEQNAIGIQMLEHWTHEASRIIVGVYDEESYLIATRR